MRILGTLMALLVMTGPFAPADEVAMIPVDGDGAKYWPKWRGPSGQGLAAGSGDVDTWCDTESVKWKTKLDTPGNGSPTWYFRTHSHLMAVGK